MLTECAWASVAQGQQSCEPLRCERIREADRSYTCPFGGYRTVEDLPLQSWSFLSMSHSARHGAEPASGAMDMDGDGQLWSVLRQCPATIEPKVQGGPNQRYFWTYAQTHDAARDPGQRSSISMSTASLGSALVKLADGAALPIMLGLLLTAASAHWPSRPISQLHLLPSYLGASCLCRPCASGHRCVEDA